MLFENWQEFERKVPVRNLVRFENLEMKLPCVSLEHKGLFISHLKGVGYAVHLERGGGRISEVFETLEAAKEAMRRLYQFNPALWTRNPQTIKRELSGLGVTVDTILEGR
jgi:hypothetical protein